jgi:hypothetical protein
MHKVAQNVGYFRNFHVAAQSKQSPIGRKFDQSGHPGGGNNILRVLFELCLFGQLLSDLIYSVEV